MPGTRRTDDSLVPVMNAEFSVHGRLLSQSLQNGHVYHAWSCQFFNDMDGTTMAGPSHLIRPASSLATHSVPVG